MPQLTDTTNAQKLTALNGYLEFLLSKYPAPVGENESEDPLILVLVAFQRCLERRIAKTRPTVEWIRIMKWSVVSAHMLLDEIYDHKREGYQQVENWNPTTTPKNMVQNTAAMLMDIQYELIGDVAKAEEYLAKELKTAAEEFVRETFAAYEAGQLELGAEDEPQAKIIA